MLRKSHGGSRLLSYRRTGAIDIRLIGQRHALDLATEKTLLNRHPRIEICPATAIPDLDQEPFLAHDRLVTQISVCVTQIYVLMMQSITCVTYITGIAPRM